MVIIGCDYHPGFQQIAYVNTETGEIEDRRLGHREEAEQFYRDLRGRGLSVRVGMEASGHGRWFERLLAELQFELCIGDAAAIKTNRVRKQKTDRQDAQLILKLLMEDRFPRIWVPDADLAMRRGRKIAKVTMARKLAVHLYWMWRKGWDYEQVKQFGSHAGELGHRHGVQ